MAVAPARRPNETLSTREFAELAPRLKGFLGACFERLSEDQRQMVTDDALVDLAQARAQKPGELQGEAAAWTYVKRAARSHAISRIRAERNPVRSAEVHDPREQLFVDRIDEGADPARQVESAMSAAEVADLLGELSETERTVVFAKDVLGEKPKEIRKRLGLSRRGFDKVAPRVHLKLAEALAAKDSALWKAGTAHLIAAVLGGTADEEQRQRFDSYYAKLPKFREAVAQHEATYQSILVAMPADTAARVHGGGGVIERAIGAIEHPRETVGSLMGRGGGDAAQEGLSQAAASGGARGGGGTAVAGGGAVAGWIGGKAVVTACVGGAAACLAGGAAVVGPPWAGLADENRPAEQRPAHPESSGHAQAPIKAGELLPPQVGHEAPEPTPQPPSDSEPPAPAPAPAPAPEPAPAPAPAPAPEPTPTPAEAVSDPALAEPAPAPSGSSGSATGGGGGTSGAVQQEFGVP